MNPLEKALIFVAVLGTTIMLSFTAGEMKVLNNNEHLVNIRKAVADCNLTTPRHQHCVAVITAKVAQPPSELTK